MCMRGFCKYSGITQLLRTEDQAFIAPFKTASRPSACSKIDVFAQTNLAISFNQRYL